MKGFKVSIRELKTDQEVHSFITSKTGDALGRLLNGLDRQTDLEKYYVELETTLVEYE